MPMTTWHGGNLPWETPTHKAILSFDLAVLRDHMTNYNHYISTTPVSMAT